jgi:hypothetical protein
MTLESATTNRLIIQKDHDTLVLLVHHDLVDFDKAHTWQNVKNYLG